MGISVVGLGKLGACMAASFADAGFEVVGVDVAPETVARVAAGRAPVVETGLDELLAANAARISATTDTSAAVAATDITFVIVPTPSEPGGGFSLSLVREAFAAIGRGLARKPGWHTVVLTSTVLPGSMRNSLIPVLEQASGRRCGRDFGVCYSPAFIALGSVIRDFTHPDLVLVGESDVRAGQSLCDVYRRVHRNDPPIRRMTLENAELTKLALNTFVTLKISFANMLADLCERLPGGDVDVVTDALAQDRRVGRHYLKGGAAYGGPCFPRDNRALAALARQLGTSVPLAESTDRVNHEVARQLSERALTLLEPGATALILGLAYKPGTGVTEESAGLSAAQHLLRAGIRVLAWDPLAAPPAGAAAPDGAVATGAAGESAAPQFEWAASLAEGVAAADLVLVTTPDAGFRELGPGHFAGRDRPVVVLDCWRLLREELEGAPGVRYHAVGLGAPDVAWGGHARTHTKQAAQTSPAAAAANTMELEA